VSVCLSAKISPDPHTQSIPIFMDVAYGRGSVLHRQGDKILREGAIVGVFFHIDNALYRIAFGTHTNTAERNEMPFWMMSGLGLRKSVLRVGDYHRKGSSNFGGNMCPTSPTSP